MPNRMMLSVQATPDVGAIRTSVLFNEQQTIIPAIALVEGVLWPANAPAPELALAEEFGRFPDGWNGRPVVFDHPKIDGMAVSASHPDVLEDVAFGQLFNTSIENGKLKTEIWINESRVTNMPEDVQEVVRRLKAGDETIEVSTGLFTMSEQTSGTFEGQEFEAIWRNIVPDHLAILPEGIKGACSVEDGCGAPRTNSIVPVMRAAHMKITNEPTITADCGCTDDTKLNMFQKIMGAVGNALGVNEASDESVDVSNEVVGSELDVETVDVTNTTETQDGTIQENSMSTKDQLVQGLIDNASTQYSDDDRDWLSTLEESQLAKMSPAVNDEAEVMGGTDEGEEVPIAAAPAQEEVVDNAATPITTDDYIAAAPAEVREVLGEGLRMHRSRKDAIVKGLLANARNKFSKAQLDAKSLSELETINALAADITFEGAGASLTANSAEDDSPPQPMPLFNLNASKSA